MEKHTKIKLLIFSRDRALQLNTLLDSIELNAANIFDPHILWTNSNKFYEDGYYKLIDKWTNKVTFQKETIFKDNVLEFINNCDNDLICYGVDDNIIYRNIESPQDIYGMLKYDNVLCYSLRLGANVTHETYYGGNPVPQIPFQETSNSRVWEWKKAGHSCLGYPLSVDFHVFRTCDMKYLATLPKFDSPNTFEGDMVNYAGSIRTELMASPKLSCVYGNSINRTSPGWLNFAGGIHPYSLEELNEKWLQGYEVDLSRMEFSHINSIHHETRFEWKKV